MESAHKLKDLVVARGTVTPAEASRILLFQRRLGLVNLGNVILKLFCEGHNEQMQVYLRHQYDNSKPANMLEQTQIFLSRLCPTSKHIDDMDPGDVQILISSIEFINEMCQGPCLSNSEFLVSTGINDTFMKLIRSNFSMLCILENQDRVAPGDYEIREPLPEAGRHVKGLVFECINAILDGHNESLIYNAVAGWLDRPLLKERLVRMHHFFLSKFCGRDPQQSFPRAVRMPTEEQMQGVLYNLTEDDVEQFFQEPLQLMKLVRAISSTSSSFTEEMEPVLPENTLANVTEYSDACRYFQAFHFFSMQVRCIEFVLPTQQLSASYFIRPMPTWYFLAAAKDKIVSVIELGTQDAKIAEFVLSATDHFVQMEHTRRMSDCKLCGCYPFRFFLASNGVNLKRLNAFKLILNFALCALLLFTIGEPADDQLVWQGRRLMASIDRETVEARVVYSSQWGEEAVRVLGVVICACAAIVIIVMGLLYVPVLFAKELEDAEEIKNEGSNKYGCVIGALGCLVVLLAFAGSCFLSISGTAVSGYDPRYTFLIFLPSLLATKLFFESLGGDGPSSYATCILGTLAGIMRNETLFADVICFYLARVSVINEDPFWWSVTLLEVIFVSAELRTAVDAVVIPFKALMNMVALMLIAFFIFGFYAFYAYSDIYKSGECDGLLSCSFFTLYAGMWEPLAIYLQGNMEANKEAAGARLLKTRVEGGGGGDMSDISISRGLYDASFFILITVLMLSMVSGIIIDQFGSIRDANNERRDLLQNFDFISGCQVEDLKKAARRLNIAKGYEDHSSSRQNMWDYSSFIYYVQNKRQMDLTGPESYIKHCLQRKDNRWVPAARCMLLERAEQQDKEEDDGDQAVEKLEARLMAQIERSTEKLGKLVREQMGTRDDAWSLV